MNNIELIITLTLIRNLGRKTLNKIIKYSIINNLQPYEILNNLNNFNLKQKIIITDEELKCANTIAKNTIEFCKKENIKILTLLDEDFPTKLKYIDDNPVIIYYKGNKKCLSDKSIAIIGTRTPSLHGIDVCYKISSELTKRGHIIVSGLAKGCDTFAHKGCVDFGGNTVAVMPCGLNNIYPKQNSNLFAQILKNNGCIISEYSPYQTVSKYKLIERDRLQSALSDGVIVIESNVNGGSFHTVSYAIAQNKLVACYKHDKTYSNLNSVKGNLKLLQNRQVTPIYDKKSFNQFINKVNSIYNCQITNIKKQKYKNYEQLKFKFL